MNLSNPMIVAKNVRGFFGDFPPSPNLKGWLTTLTDEGIYYLLSLFAMSVIEGDEEGDADAAIFAVQVLSTLAVNLSKAGEPPQEDKIMEMDEWAMTLGTELVTFVEMEALRRKGHVNYDYQGSLEIDTIQNLKLSKNFPEGQNVVDLLKEVYSEAVDMPVELLEEAGMFPDLSQGEGLTDSGLPSELTQDVNLN